LTFNYVSFPDKTTVPVTLAEITTRPLQAKAKPTHINDALTSDIAAENIEILDIPIKRGSCDAPVSSGSWTSKKRKIDPPAENTSQALPGMKAQEREITFSNIASSNLCVYPDLAFVGINSFQCPLAHFCALEVYLGFEGLAFVQQ
jgi:hypothetical protein